MASQAGGGQPTAGPASEQAAAQSLSRLLTQSISDRSAILSAYNDVDTCGPGVAQDAQTFRQAATSRQNLLARLGALPGASALPSRLLQSLTGAWQASVAADQDYAGWAGDESTHGCRAHDTADTRYPGDERGEPRGDHGQDHLHRPVEPDRAQVQPAHLPPGRA